MRYYRLELFESDAKTPILGVQPLSSHVMTPSGMIANLSALQVEFDVPITSLALPQNWPTVKIWGVALQKNGQIPDPTLGYAIGQASDFNGKVLKLDAGFANGLPLATNAAQYTRTILQGQIWQSFGNWIDTTQWLEFVVVSNGANFNQQLNIEWSYTAGTLFSDAITQTFSKALPGYEVIMQISPKLTYSQPLSGSYQSFTQFSDYIQSTTKEIGSTILGPDYQGVQITILGNRVRVWDGQYATQANPTKIDFIDLIGQPTWLQPNYVQFTTTMRGDILPGDYVSLPTNKQAQYTTTPQSLSQYRDTSAFQGTFFIYSARHVGNFRAPDALSWVTVFDAYIALPPSA